MNEENAQNANPQTVSEQAEQAPNVATSGAPAEPAAGTIETGEVEAEQREHLERRSDPQLPDPEENVAASSDQTGNDASAQQPTAQPEQPNS